MAAAVKLSVIVNSRDEGDWLRRTVESLHATLPAEAEIVVVDDGSQDASSGFLAKTAVRRKFRTRLIVTPNLGMARARNLGGRRARGAVLIFSDAHMRHAPGWWRPLVEALERPKAGAAASIVGATEGDASEFGYGFSIPTPDLHPAWVARPKSSRPFRVPVLPGCCLAMKREVFLDTGGYDEGLRSRGGIDAELGIRFWLLGYENWMMPQSKVWHHFREQAPYWTPRADTIHNRLRTALVHFSPWRISTVLSAMGAEPSIGPAMLDALAGDVAVRRQQLHERRVYSDDWFAERFGVAW